jgi:hypothetical protein
VTRILFCILMSFALAASAAQPRVPDADARAIRAVVQGQLDAFAQNDGVRAFSYASPGINGETKGRRLARRRLQPRANRRHRGLIVQNGEEPKAFL